MKRNNDYLKGNQHAKGSKPNSTAFGKGHKPWNKGKKGIHLSPKSEFKKGQKSANHRPVGTKTVRIDKAGKERTWIKVDEPKTWVLFAVFVWIQNNGEIPKGLILHHLDENTMNDLPENLALLTRKAHFEIHGIGKIGRDSRKRGQKAKDSMGLFNDG